ILKTQVELLLSEIHELRWAEMEVGSQLKVFEETLRADTTALLEKQKEARTETHSDLVEFQKDLAARFEQQRSDQQERTRKIQAEIGEHLDLFRESSARLKSHMDELLFNLQDLRHGQENVNENLLSLHSLSKEVGGQVEKAARRERKL